MAISADMVKKLREQTGAGMMDCKKALAETDGDFEKAVELLREKGIAVAAKREAKAASEGMVGSYMSDDSKLGAFVELNCETTFVAKTDEFVQLAGNLAEIAAKSECGEVDCLLNQDDPESAGKTLGERVNSIMGLVGEKMTVARFARMSAGETSVLGTYIHMGAQIAVMVKLDAESAAGAASDDVKQLAKDLAMHISWSNPDFLVREDIPEDVIAKERDIHKKWAIEQGKPENVLDRIVDGKMTEYFRRACLIEQPFIKDEEQSIQDVIKSVASKVGEKISVADYVRYRVGETCGAEE